MLLEGSTFPMTTAAHTWTLIPAKAGVSVGVQSSQSSKCYNPFNYHTVGKITAPGIKERMSFSFNLWHDVWPKQNDLSPMSHHRLLKTAPSLLRGWSLCSVSQGNIYQLFSDASVFSSSELVLQSSPAQIKEHISSNLFFQRNDPTDLSSFSLLFSELSPLVIKSCVNRNDD